MVIVALYFARRIGRDHDLFACVLQRLDHTRAGIVSTIRNDGVGRRVGEQCIRSLQVVRLAWGQMEPRGIAQRVDGGVDLGAQSAPAASDGLRRPPFAPALC